MLINVARRCRRSLRNKFHSKLDKNDDGDGVMKKMMGSGNQIHIHQAIYKFSVLSACRHHIKSHDIIYTINRVCESLWPTVRNDWSHFISTIRLRLNTEKKKNKNMTKPINYIYNFFEYLFIFLVRCFFFF